MEARNLDKELGGLDWDAVAAQLDGLSTAPGTEGPKRFTTWLTTLNDDGTPHTTAVGAVWIDGAFVFQTGDVTRKARNLARDARCSLAISLPGVDFVVEGTAAKVTDPATVAAAVAEWNKHGWPAEADESGSRITAPFNAPGLGAPPWDVYRITARSATGMGNAEPGGATRWTF